MRRSGHLAYFRGYQRPNRLAAALGPRCHQCRRHHGRLRITASKPLVIEDRGTPRGCDRRHLGPARPR